MSHQREGRMTDEFQHWRDAVAAGRGVETQKGSIRLGYYRNRNEAVAFFRNGESGEIVCWRSQPRRPTPIHHDEMEELFSYCTAHPVSYETFEDFVARGTWPDTIAPPVEPPPDLPPEQAIDAQLTELRTHAAEMKDAKTQASADRCANLAEEFAKLEAKAEAARIAEKQPFLEGGRAVDLKWAPVVKRAADLKAWAKSRVTGFLVAEKMRLAAEENARKQETAQAREEAARTGAPPPQEPLPSAPVKAGAGTTGRKIGLRKRTEIVIDDPRAMLRWLIDRNQDVPADVVEILAVVAKREYAANREPPPGARVTQVEIAT